MAGIQGKNQERHTERIGLQIPTFATWTGSFLNIASGLYIIYRERKRKTNAAQREI